MMDKITDYVILFGKYSILFGWSNYLVNQIFSNRIVKIFSLNHTILSYICSVN